MSNGFTEEDKIKCLLWCDRHCCLCGVACGTNIELHHIEPKAENGSNNIDNAIPLCFNCHGEVEKYNDNHAVGSKYRRIEIKKRRDQIYEKYTQHILPPVHFDITQDLDNNPDLSKRNKRKLPDVGIVIKHLGDSHPVRVSVAVQVFLGNKNLGLVNPSQYNGEDLWNLNPRHVVWGHFPLLSEVVESTEEIEIRVSLTVIDQYDREHNLLPLAWIYMRDRNIWYLEPCGIEHLLKF